MLRHGKYLYVGGFEEVVRVYDVNRRKEISLLEGHSGTVNRVLAVEHFIFTGGDDGCICIWKAKTWDLIKKLEALSPIVDLCVH